MAVFLFILSVIAFLSGFGILMGSESAIHEIEAFVLYTVAAILFAGAAIVRAINRAAKRTAEHQ